MSTAQSFRIRTPNGASFACCTEEHARRWLLAAAHFHRGSRLERSGPAPAGGELPACSACAWCGNTVEAPAHGACILHDDCPDWAPMGTLVVQRAIEQLSAMIGARLPETAFGYMEDVARGQHEAGTWPNLVELIADTWVENANRVGLI